MNLKLSVLSYKGADGSSLSDARCAQIVSIYEMLQELGNKVISYVDIQNEASERDLFGKTKERNAIRTFFPLLKKIDFVQYDGQFAANTCFTKLGTEFVLTCRAMSNITKENSNANDMSFLLNRIKQNIQKVGLINMYHNDESKNHNMWVALRLLKEFKVIDWNEFLFVLYVREKGGAIDDAILKIREDKRQVDSYKFVNEKNEVLPNTCYSYIRSYLEEAGLISNLSTSSSQITEDANLFFEQINI